MQFEKRFLLDFGHGSSGACIPESFAAKMEESKPTPCNSAWNIFELLALVCMSWTMQKSWESSWTIEQNWYRWRLRIWFVQHVSTIVLFIAVHIEHHWSDIIQHDSICKNCSPRHTTPVLRGSSLRDGLCVRIFAKQFLTGDATRNQYKMHAPIRPSRATDSLILAVLVWANTGPRTNCIKPSRATDSLILAFLVWANTAPRTNCLHI